MELRHLKYFLMVAQELNFSRAAQKLFISQPPLSRQIKELEEELQVRLFERNNRQVRLTDAGAYFEKEIRQLFLSLDMTVLKTRKIALNVTGEFRIAYISSTFSSVIPNLVKYLNEQYPYVHFKLFEVATAQQILALEQGKLDLGILRAPLLSPKIRFQVWFRDGYSLVYNKEKVHIETRSDIEKLKDETFVFFNKEYAPHYYNSLLEICARYGFSPNVVHESNNIGSIIQLVRNGLGVSIVPSSLSRSHIYEELTYRPLEGLELFTEVVLASPKDENSEITKSAISFLMGSRE